MSAPSVRLFDERHHEPGPSVAEVVTKYLEEKQYQAASGAMSYKGLEQTKFYLNNFAGKFGFKNATDCKRDDLLQWLRENPTWQATATRQRAIGSVVSCMDWASEEYDIDIKLKRPRFLGPPVRPRPAITPDEYRSIKRHARRAMTDNGRRVRTGIGFRAGLIFLWRTGCRTSEMRACEWFQVDWQRQVIVLEKHKTSRKTGEFRMIPVGPVMRLLHWLNKKRRPGQSKIFTNTLGKEWTCDRYSKEFRRFARLAGVRKEVSAYCLRHGLCVRLLDAGVGNRQIADVMGHSTTKYVDWYGRQTRSMGAYLNRQLKNDKGK